jgi:hypothetical protein
MSLEEIIALTVEAVKRYKEAAEDKQITVNELMSFITIMSEKIIQAFGVGENVIVFLEKPEDTIIE